MTKRVWVWGLALLTAIAVGWLGQGDRPLQATIVTTSSVVAQAPTASPTVSLSPVTTSSPAATPALTAPPSPTGAPKLPTRTPAQPPAKLPPVPTVPAAPPLPLEGTYQDPAGRFKVGLLKGYVVSPIAGSVLVESTDGSLAYAVVTQAQPSSGAIGLTPGFDNDNLAKVALAVFQRGEGFQPGAPQPEAGGGVVMNWTGSLTIAGKAQPVGGAVLVRPSLKNILLLIVTATEAESGQVQQVFATLAPTLQTL